MSIKEGAQLQAEKHSPNPSKLIPCRYITQGVGLNSLQINSPTNGRKLWIFINGEQARVVEKCFSKEHGETSLE